MRSRTLITVTIAAALLAAIFGAASAPAEENGPGESQHLRDVVLPGPPQGSARKLARMSTGRYPVGDSVGRTVEISVTAACQASCTAGNPAQLAQFLGSLPHRDEIRSLSVVVASMTLGELDQLCGGGGGILACYYSGTNQMIVPGDDFVSPGDNADRPFVIAHEYGHHIANHRRNPPFVPTVFYGTKRWVTYERVCPGTGAGRYFPGNGGSHYYENPGEAFAEAYAFTRFPNKGVIWNWDESLRPNARASRAIRADVLHPWLRRTRIVREGTVGRRHPAVTRRIATPLDGDLSLKLRGAPGSQLDLIVRNARGRLLSTAANFGAKEKVQIRVCGQRDLRVTIRQTGRGPGGAFRLIALRP